MIDTQELSKKTPARLDIVTDIVQFSKYPLGIGHCPKIPGEIGKKKRYKCSPDCGKPRS